MSFQVNNTLQNLMTEIDISLKKNQIHSNNYVNQINFSSKTRKVLGIFY
jgi:hypothetical protein